MTDNPTEKVPEKYRPALLALMREWQERVVAGREELRTSWRVSPAELNKLNKLTKGGKR